MRIGIYVAQVGVLSGHERMASGHVQIPLHSAGLLRDAGHQVELISTPLTGGRVLPDCMPAGLRMHEVTDASRQGSRLEHQSGRRRGVRPIKLASWLRDLSRLARQLDLDVLHFFGANRTANLAGLFRAVASPCPVVVTCNVGTFPEPWFFVTQHFWKRIDRVITSTEYFRKTLGALGITAHLVRHGIVKDLRQPGPPRRRQRVLFWREATPRNGGDIAVSVFEKLAPRYPDITFDFAVRDHWSEVYGLDELTSKYQNIGMYCAPYPPGVSLEALMAEAICVLQPFREYTVQPQLSILESLAAGVPVVASDLDSTSELIESGANGFIVPIGDAAQAAAAVERLIQSPDLARSMGLVASESVAARWNWNSYSAELERHYRSVIENIDHVSPE